MNARVIGAALLALAEPAAAAQAPLPVKVYGSATAVDGDGLRLIGGTEIRLFGIDAPEMRGEPEAGRRARAALDDLVAGGAVACEVRDRNRQRLVAVCATADGRIADLGLKMLSLGHAVVYRRFTAGTEFAEAYDRAERQARVAGLGLWKVNELGALSERLDQVAESIRESAKQLNEPGVLSDGLNQIATSIRENAEPWWKDVPFVVLSGLLALAAALWGARVGGKMTIAAAIKQAREEARLRSDEEEKRRAQEQEDLRRLLGVELDLLAREYLQNCNFWGQRVLSERHRSDKWTVDLVQSLRIPPAIVFTAHAAKLTLLPPEVAMKLTEMQVWVKRLMAIQAKYQGMPRSDPLPEAEATPIWVCLAKICRRAADALDLLGVDAIAPEASQSETLQKALRDCADYDPEAVEAAGLELLRRDLL